MSNKEHVLSRISESDVSEYPWRHIIIKDFLPEPLYAAIKSEVLQYVGRPETKRAIREAKLSPTRQGDGTKSYHVCINKSVGIFPPIEKQPNLNEYYKILLDKDVENALKDKVLVKECRGSENAVDMYGQFDVLTSNFIYDEVHPDHSAKVLTMLHYFADAADDESLGTLLYAPDKIGADLSTSKDYLGSAPYIPNCAFVFSPCDKKGFRTNHSFMHTSKKTIYRKALQTFWMREHLNWSKPQSGRVRLD